MPDPKVKGRPRVVPGRPSQSRRQQYDRVESTGIRIAFQGSSFDPDFVHAIVSRRISRRFGVTLAHAALVAELAGLGGTK